jgi:FkbM family methyltransferase
LTVQKDIGKIYKGVWLPATDTHFPAMMDKNPEVHGRGTYQHKKFVASMRYVHKRRVALDIGAHVGFWTMSLRRNFEQVIAFEPHALHAELFRRNIAGAKNVVLHEVALGAGSGMVDLIYTAGNTGNTHIKMGPGSQVPMTTLESYTSQLAEVDFIKVDVEGFELNVLEGATPTILRCKPVIICENKGNDTKNFEGEGKQNAIAYLESLGMVRAKDLGGDFIMIWPKRKRK